MALFEEGIVFCCLNAAIFVDEEEGLALCK